MNHLRVVSRKVSYHCCNLSSVPSRYKSTALNEIVDPIVLSDDKSYYICWHPEKPYPYECTKPLPAEKEQDRYVLKNMGDAKKIYEKPKHPNTTAEEMAKLTFTTKHRWFPRSRDKYAKNTPPDREYL